RTVEGDQTYPLINFGQNVLVGAHGEATLFVGRAFLCRGLGLGRRLLGWGFLCRGLGRRRGRVCPAFRGRRLCRLGRRLCRPRLELEAGLAVGLAYQEGGELALGAVGDEALQQIGLAFVQELAHLGPVDLL